MNTPQPTRPISQLPTCIQLRGEGKTQQKDSKSPERTPGCVRWGMASRRVRDKRVGGGPTPKLGPPEPLPEVPERNRELLLGTNGERELNPDVASVVRPINRSSRKEREKENLTKLARCSCHARAREREVFLSVWVTSAAWQCDFDSNSRLGKSKQRVRVRVSKVEGKGLFWFADLREREERTYGAYASSL